MRKYFLPIILVVLVVSSKRVVVEGQNLWKTFVSGVRGQRPKILLTEMPTAYSPVYSIKIKRWLVRESNVWFEEL